MMSAFRRAKSSVLHTCKGAIGMQSSRFIYYILLWKEVISMTEHGKPGGRWEYTHRPRPAVQVYSPTATEIVLWALVSLITIGLVIALGVLIVLPLI